MSDTFYFRATLNRPSSSTVHILQGLMEAFNQHQYERLKTVLEQYDIEKEATLAVISACFSDYSDYADQFKADCVQLLISTASDNEVEMSINESENQIVIDIEGQDHGADDFGAAFFGILSALEYEELHGAIKTMGLISNYVMNNGVAVVEHRERDY